MAVDFSKFDKMIDVEGLKNDEAEAADNNGSYEEVPHGNYEVQITKMELRESKKGDPMVTIWFKILTGEYEKSLIFMNQVVTKGFQLNIVNTLLRTIDSESVRKTAAELDEIDIKNGKKPRGRLFDSYSQYEQLLLDVAEDIETDGLEFALEYGENKGFNTFKILEVFEAE